MLLFFLCLLVSTCSSSHGKLQWLLCFRQQQQQPPPQQQQQKVLAIENTASSADGANSSSSSTPAVTEQHKELTTHATQEFDKGNFSQCVSWMAKLSKARGTDPKVVHNHAVAVFYQSNQCAVEELKNGLNAACQLVLSLSASEVLEEKTNKKVCLQFSSPWHYLVFINLY